MTLFIQNDYRTKARTATFEDENQNTLSADILIDLYDVEQPTGSNLNTSYHAS